MTIILIALIILQLILTPTYVIAIKPGFSKKTLLLKILCSTIFILTGLVCSLKSGGFNSSYAIFMIIGFVCSWFGDIMLHLEPNIIKYIIGGLGFICAHILYITTFINTEASLVGVKTIISKRDIIIMACVYAAAIGLYLLMKLKAGKLLVPIMIYCLILSFMLSKAIDLGIATINSGIANNIPAGIILIAGASLFVISDFMLGIGFFGDKSYKKQVINMVAYFPAQMLLAVSILFLNRI